MKTRSLVLKLIAAMALAVLPVLPAQSFAAEKIIVFAAASMKTALDAANAVYARKSGHQVTASYAASSALAGAPADVFISADLDWMDYLAKKNLIKPDSRKSLLGNRIVLVAPKDKAKPVDIKAGFDLSALVGDGKLAMGAVNSVPAGKYGKAALEKLGAWSAVASKVAGAENVRAALLLVSRGEAPYGIVYQTDAAADPGVSIVGTFPPDSHPAIIYPVAQVTDAKSAAASDYLKFLSSAEASGFFTAQGFTILK